MKTKLTFIAIIAWFAILFLAAHWVETPNNDPCIPGQSLIQYPGSEDDTIIFHTDSDTTWYVKQ